MSCYYVSVTNGRVRDPELTLLQTNVDAIVAFNEYGTLKGGKEDRHFMPRRTGFCLILIRSSKLYWHDPIHKPIGDPAVQLWEGYISGFIAIIKLQKNKLEIA
jgi:hypothetical protein